MDKISKEVKAFWWAISSFTEENRLLEIYYIIIGYYYLILLNKYSHVLSNEQLYKIP